MSGYPWQESQWHNLTERLIQNTLPHALLLYGPGGIGKADFAAQFTHALLCQHQRDDGQPCGSCAPCLLYAADNHPDCHVIEPEKAGGVIKIDQIRTLIAELSLSSHSGGYKVAIVRPAEAMNIAAANSLLKTLEEPAAKTVIILLAEQLSQLPATIRSRCQKMRFTLPEPAMAQNWLREKLAENEGRPEMASQLLMIAQGAPLKALADAEKDLPALRQSLLEALLGLSERRLDPVKVAGEWLKLEQPMPIKYLHGWVSDMIRLRQIPLSFADNTDYQKVLHSLCTDIEVQKLYVYLDRIAESLPLMAQLNPLPIIESLLIHWANMPKQKTIMQG